MSETIYELLKRHQSHWQRHDGFYGVEIETETDQPYDIPDLKWWYEDEDGSLRGFGVEYITKAPLDDTSLSLAMEEFKGIDIDFNPPSISNSVHVHRNVLNEQPIVLANVLTTYAIIEPVMVKFAGPFRESNLFCLQLRDAEGGLNSILDILLYVGSNGRSGGLDRHSPHRTKYAALNIGSFYELGSIEFRALRGTTNPDLILQWIEMIKGLFEFAKSYESPEDILEVFQKDLENTLDLIFGKHASDLEYPGWRTDVEKNFWYGWRIATSENTWESFGERALPRLSKFLVQRKAIRRAEYRRTSPEEEYSTAMSLCLSDLGVHSFDPEEGVDFTWIDDLPPPAPQPTFDPVFTLSTG